MNNRWVDDAVDDNALVCQVLLQLHQEVSQLPMPQLPPPPPPPPQAPEQDAPALFKDWGVRQRRSRRTEVRPVAARSEVIGASNIGAISGSKMKEAGRRSLNRSNASKSKDIYSVASRISPCFPYDHDCSSISQKISSLPSPFFTIPPSTTHTKPSIQVLAVLLESSGRRTPTKRPGKLKKLVKIGDREAMLEEKQQRKRERGITKTAIKGINDKESFESNTKPQSQGERRNDGSIFVCG